VQGNLHLSRTKRNPHLSQVAAIVREIKEHGTEEDIEVLNYILWEEAGSNKKMWANGCMDCDRDGNLLECRRRNGGGSPPVSSPEDDPQGSIRPSSAHSCASPRGGNQDEQVDFARNGSFRTPHRGMCFKDFLEHR